LVYWPKPIAGEKNLGFPRGPTTNEIFVDFDAKPIVDEFVSIFIGRPLEHDKIFLDPYQRKCNK